MKFPDSLLHWILKNNNNYFIMGAVTFSFPKQFIRSIYNKNKGKHSWNGKKSCVTISFDCDYPKDIEAIPNILKTLSNYSFKTSFACVGHWIEKYPDEHKMILDYGHEIVNHTYSHPDNELLNPGRKFRYISRAEKIEEIKRCHDICMKILKYEPIGCRIPHFKHLFSTDIYSILKEINYKYSSSTWLTNTESYGLPFVAEGGIMEFPLSTCPSHPFSVFDTWHSLNTPRLTHRMIHRGPEQYLKLFKLLVDLCKETGSYLNIYIDPLDIEKLPDFKLMMDMISDKDIIVCTYDEYINNYNNNFIKF